ncbi:MAG: hypothetical protein NZM27_11785 [Acetobacteraceae bacterium]|nr:hypothetical protein [Acetobacteraceae bacterium]MCX7686249.1 hypothetical protein [Acetobacteraceae bacterium]MDW8397688.1 hypothetical protein [Acetobacteraceae bacterium]
MTTGFLRRLMGAARSDEPGAFGRFLGRQAVYVTQKTVVDYCRVKAGLAEAELFADRDFLAAMRHCRWQVYFGAISDVAALAEAWLRPHAGAAAERVAGAIAALAQEAFDSEPPPEEERDAAREARAAIPRRLSGLLAAPPLPANLMPLAAQAPLLATLPVHPDQRIGEEQAIRGALRFHIIAAQQEMERRFDAPRLAARLAA